MTDRITLGVDPGNNTGIAWGYNGRLVACYLAAPGDELVVPSLFIRDPALGIVVPIHAVFELPKFYGVKAYGTASKAYGVGNSLIREAVTLGEWKREARRLGATLEEVLPRDWKSTINKRAMLKVIWERLSRDERALVKALGLPASLVHNVLDAVGVMLWSCGRLELKRFS